MLHYCDVCKNYTIQNKICIKCGGKLRTTYPPKYSPQDKYQKYRLEYFKKKFDEEEKNLSLSK